jgi:hypothetical protein
VIDSAASNLYLENMLIIGLYLYIFIICRKENENQLLKNWKQWGRWVEVHGSIIGNFIVYQYQVSKYMNCVTILGCSLLITSV